MKYQSIIFTLSMFFVSVPLFTQAAVDIELDESINVETSTSSIATSTGSNTDDKNIIITQADLVDISVNGTTTASPANVNTKENLKSYAISLASSDSNIREISFVDGEVQIKYKEPGKLVGIIPITMYITVKVDANGNVKVLYPWYSVLTLMNKGSIESELRNEVDTVILAYSNDENELSPKVQAALVSKIHSALKNNYDLNESSSEEIISDEKI